MGKLARSVWETFYSGVEDAPRSSLEHMRQLLDLLFRKLAPDDEVRQSKFFKTKSGEKPQQVHRGERLSYAASKHVADQSMRDLLLGQARQISVLYKKLNKLHGTDPPRKVAEEILTEAQAVLEQWVRVLGL
ncbi:MAG TPA: hypothetical protein DCM87_20270 [Planctomycetes bacterium]|nr:hypothetical protein [Planctomycetota bacterium]